MKSSLRLLFAGLAALGLAGRTSAIGLYTGTDHLPLETGYTVATCYSSTNLGAGVTLPLPDPNGNVVVVWNTSPTLPNGLTGKPVNSPNSAAANWHYYHNEVALQNPVVGPAHEWKAKNLGEVFGVALDDSQPPNIYVASTTCYGYEYNPASGPGCIFRLNATTGAITASLPMPGSTGGTPQPGNGNAVNNASLGNLCWVRTPNGTPWLYVTNMGDGKIYRVNPSSLAPTASFDHGTQALPVAAYPSLADNPSLVFTQEERRPWGIGYYCGRIYYSIFASMDAAPPMTNPLANGKQAEIWSVAIDSAGNFLPATSVREFKLPVLGSAYGGFGALNRSSMPVSDIEFTLGGAMLLAERYHTACTTTSYAGYSYLLGAHSTRALEYTGSSGAWVPSPQTKFGIGSLIGPVAQNSAGGVAPNCDGDVWVTGDALGPFQSLAAYGQQRIGGLGNAGDPTPLTNSHIIDFDCQGTFYGKSLIGDVDSVIEPPKVQVKFVSAVCPAVAGQPYTVTLNVTNLTANPLSQLVFGACPAAFLPPGGVSLVPSPNSIAVTIPAYGSVNVIVSMASLPIGGKKCFSVQADPPGGGSGAGGDPFACSPKVCVELPKCPCMEVMVTNTACPIYEGQEHTATITIKNLWNVTAYNYQLLPCPQNDLPPGAITLQPNPAGIQPLSPALAPGATSGPLTLSFPGLPVQQSPVTVCFIVQLLPQDWEHEGAFCETKLCITYPACPPLLPCVVGDISNIQCPAGPPGNYTMSLTVTNMGPVPAGSAFLSPCPPPAGGGIPGNPSPPMLTFSPPLNQGQSSTQTIQLGGVGTAGALACFCLTLVDLNGRPICNTIVCKQLPPCPCATFAISGITCPQYEGQPVTATVTVTNTGWQPIFWLGLSPCPNNILPPGAIPNVIPGPALSALPPLMPGNSQSVPVTLSGVPNSGGIVCFNISALSQMENQPLCTEKVCITIPPCPNVLPCMSITNAAPQCPVVQGGPFSVSVTVTNLQPIPAASAQLVPCLPGLFPGEVAATPVPGSVNLPPLLQNQSQTFTVGLTGVNSGQIACFCVRLLDANHSILCERPVCVTLPFCPPLCATVTPLDVTCPPGGSPNFNAFLQITNLSGTSFNWFSTAQVPPAQLPPGAITGQPQPAGLNPINPTIPPNGSNGVMIQLPPGLPSTGGTFCFTIKFYGANETEVICQQRVCLNLPVCQCGAVLDHHVDCVTTPAGVKRQLTITVQNLTNVYGTPFNFDVATITPGTGFLPAVVVPSPNPIPPGGTGTITTCFTGKKPPQCINILLTNAARTLCCPLKLCPLWVDCAEPYNPHRCEIASQFTSENGGLVNASAWIYNGTNTPKTFTYTITPVSVPGCTGSLPPAAIFPASGTTMPVGAFSSLGVNFSISGASLAAGQCAGFMICFQPVGPGSGGTTPFTCCTSKVKRSSGTDLCVDWNPAGFSLPSATGVKTIVIKNPTSVAMPVSLRLVQSGGTEMSLTGDFPADGGSTGLGGPPVELDFIPIETVLQPFQQLPVSFTARAKAVIGPDIGVGPGPNWQEWQLLKLCNVQPYSPVDPVDDPHTLGSAVVFVPPAIYGSPLPMDQRDYGFIHVDEESEWVSLTTYPGEFLVPESSEDLHGFFSDWFTPYGTVQAADGSIAGTGQTLYAMSEKPKRGPIRRFLCWVRKRNT